MIVVLQDTLEFGMVVIDEGLEGDVPVRVNNSHPITEIKLPFNLTGPSNVRIEDFTLTPLLDGWTKQKVFDNTWFGQGAWLLRAGISGTPLPAGGGLIGNLTVNAISAAGDGIETVDTATLGSGHTLGVVSEWAEFVPKFVAGEITVVPPPCACDCHAAPDAQCTSSLDVLDVVQAVNVAFRSFPGIVDPNGACPYETTDVDCDGDTDVLDVVRFVNVAFRNFDPAGEICDPCQ
jgi:hypothetical protein